MPKGDNPNSRANLAKGKRFNEETARIAGQKSAASKAVVKPFAEYLREQLEKEVKDGVITKEALTMTLLKQVQNGNIKAWELLLKLVGEFPAENVNLHVNEPTDESVNAMLAELQKRG